MDGIIVVLVVFAIVGLFFLWFNRYADRKWKKSLSTIQKSVFWGYHVEGLRLPKDALCKIYGDKKQLSIKFKKHEIIIPAERIISFDYFTEQEVIDKTKSVVGRAVIGGVLLGGLGAVVGAASGIGTKKVVKDKGYVVINYSNKNDETAVISFMTQFRADVFAEEFSHLFGLVNQKQTDPQII